MTPHQDGLPALPEPVFPADHLSENDKFSTTQMRDYGAACFEAGKLAAQPLPVQGETRPYEPDPQFDHRYKVEQRGFWWWLIRAGDGKQTIFKAHTKIGAEEMAQELMTAFRDGEFVGQKSLAAHPNPQPASPERKPLTDKQMDEIVTANAGYGNDDFGNVIRAVERYHGITATQEPRT